MTMLQGIAVEILCVMLFPVLGQTRCSDGSCSTIQGQSLIQVQMMSRLSRDVGHHRCKFANPPQAPYYWEPECEMGIVGCMADGRNPECRFCDFGNVTCPLAAKWPETKGCEFDQDTTANMVAMDEIGFFWDTSCKMGMIGCNADGKNVGCRFCNMRRAGGAYSDIKCEVEECTFDNEPLIPYFNDPTCVPGMLGCLADNKNLKCRFCGAGAYENISCKASAAIPSNACWFRGIGSELPYMSTYWQPNCHMGMLGCWADGVHAECRFCNGTAGPYTNVSCPL